MAGAWRTISVALTANTTGYTAGLRTAAGQTQRFEKETASSTQRASGAWSKLGLIAKGAGVGMALALFEAGRSAVEFEARMRNVNSISGMTEAQLASTSKQVLNLSRAFPQSANALAEGLYEIASSGFQAKDGMTVLEASAKAASAGLTTTDNAAKAITATLNAYGQEADQAEFVSDALFQTVNVGVVSFEELSGVIGDVVGTAAAAGQGIDEVGQAIATMTLSGISANEAGTSLNRLLQGLIDPSDELKTQLQELGYESGAQALEVDGLAGVVQKLTGASEGSIETLLKWFPEIRAARGALALMNNEGAIYKDTIDKWSAAHEGAGATQKAFAEQMKSVKAQLTLLFNGLRASGIELGTHFLPYIQGAIKTLKDLGNSVLPFVRDRWEDLTEVAGDLRVILGEVIAFAGRSAKALGMIGGAAIMGAIAGLTEGLSAVTGFLADHPALIRAITVALGALAAVRAFNILASGAETFAIKAMYLGDSLSGVTGRVKLFGSGLRDVVTTGASMTQGVGKMKGAFAGLGQAMASPQFQAAALTAGFLILQNMLQDTENQARRTIDGVTAGIEDPADKIRALNKQVASLQDKAGEGFSRPIGPVKIYSDNDAKKAHVQLDLINGDLEKQYLLLAAQQHVQYDPNGDNAEAIEKQLLATDKLNKAQEKHVKHQKAVQVATKVTGATISEMSKKSEEELDAFLEAGAKMQVFVDKVGLLGPTVVNAEGMTAEAFGAMADDAQKFIESVGQSFADYGDIVGALGAQHDVGAADIRKFYTRVTTNTRHFTEDIKTAIANGLDPQFVARLLEAGPEAAGPLVESLVGNNSKNVIGMVNDGEEALRDFNAMAVEMARLTNIAIQDLGSDGAKHLDTAMKISQLIAANGGKLTAQALADKLQKGVAEVAFIAAEYGIALADGVNPLLHQLGAQEIGRAAVGRVGGTHSRPLAEGGHIDPALYGDTRRDSVPAVLMPGEVVVRRDSVRRFGVRNMLDLNKGKVPAGWSVPGFAGGGFVTEADVPTPPDVSGHGPGVGGSGAATMKHGYDTVVDWMKKNAMAGVGPGTPEQAVAWMRAAILATGVPMNWLGPLLARAKQESGFNPRAINLWDSNAKKGIPSMGWMQTIRPTFDAYALPGMGDIWNPVHNAAAAIRYIQARYGTVFNLPAGGYAAGGLVGPPRGGLPYGSYDRGGYLPEGLSLAYNGTGRPEPVGHGIGDVMVTVYIGNQQLDGRIDYRVGVNNERVATELRKGTR